MRRRLRATTWGACALLVAQAECRADDAAVRLDYVAPAECPAAAAFSSEVQARLTQGRITESAVLARTYRVRVARDGDAFVARLEFTDVDGARAEREVRSATCDEAARAMALVTALAIEARVAEEEQAAKKPEPRPSPEPSAPAPQPAPRPARAEPRTPSDPTFGFGTEVGADSSFAPKLAPSIALAAEAFVGPGLARARIRFADSGPTRVDGGSAEFSLWVLGVEACPAALRPLAGLALLPCGGLEGGVVRAAGKKSERITEPKSTSGLWFSPELALRVELLPDPGLAFGFEGALGFPVTRHEFVLEKPDVVVHEVPAVVWKLGAGLTARFR